MEKEIYPSVTDAALIDRSGNSGLLLIEPPFYRLYKNTYSLTRLPLALGYLAGIALKYTDWRVMIFNADFYPNESPIELQYLCNEGFSEYLRQIEHPTRPLWDIVTATVQEFRPKIVGITSKSQNFASACIVAEKVKAVDPNIMVVIGGPHPSMVRKDIFGKTEHIDVGVIGEGELTLLDLMKVADGQKTLDSVDGIVYRQGDIIIENPTRMLMEDLDSLFFPVMGAKKTLKDFHLYPKMAFQNIFAIRGCPNRCTFCGSHKIWGRKPRFRSISNVIEEMAAINEMGCVSVNFDDDTFGCNKSHIRELCNAIATKLPKLKWSCEMHVNLVDYETVSIMRNSGCRYISIGVESGNNEILRAVRKGYTIERAFSAAATIKKAGIALGCFFMVGFPDETIDSLNDTIRAIRTFPSDEIIYSIFMPYPGTKLFQYCLDRGIVTEDFDVSRFNHQSPLSYFCPNIPKPIFLSTVRGLEIEITKLNRPKTVRRIFSAEGWLKLKEYGIRDSIYKFYNIIKHLNRKGVKK